MSRHHFVSILALAAGAASLAVGCSGAQDSTDAPDNEHTGAATQHWDTESPTDESQSTHMWIVDKAIGILSQHPELSAARDVMAVLNKPSCKSAWRVGIDEADRKAIYNDGNLDLPDNPTLSQIAASGATWKSHFYDPDTGLNYKGESSPTARSRANELLVAALPLIQAGNLSDGCYKLGVSLHYLTDLTQPMHAANYTATDKPYKRHTNFEAYAMQHQGSVGAVDANVDLASGPPDDVLYGVAKRAKGRWAALRSALNGGSWTCLDAEALDPESMDHQCWAGTTDLDAQLAVNLQAAQVETARYLYAVGKLLMSPDGCQQASDKYGIDYVSGSYGFAPQNVTTWWDANHCRTSPATNACQIASNEYGIYHTVTWAFAPQDVRDWWVANNCGTHPQLSACQIASNKYGINPVTCSWGFAPQDVRTWWDASGCTTLPQIASTCQIASDEYGTNHTVTWGFAPPDVRDWWVASGCATHPDAGAPAGQFQLQNVMAGTCLNVDGGSSELGTNTHQYQCDPNNGANLWTWLDAGNHRGMLRNVMANTCLNVAWGSSAPGANALQYYCDWSNAANLWEWVGFGKSRQLRNVMAGSCLNVVSGSNMNGTDAVQYYCDPFNAANLWDVAPL